MGAAHPWGSKQLLLPSFKWLLALQLTLTPLFYLKKSSKQAAIEQDVQFQAI